MSKVPFEQVVQKAQIPSSVFTPLMDKVAVPLAWILVGVLLDRFAFRSRASKA